MSESDRNQHNGSSDEVHLDKRADILQAFCVHYYKMAMDHHTKAATTSNILLLIVAAIISVVGFDKQICGTADLVGAIGLFLIGFFGVAWVWRQHELYFYWESIAEGYQQELKNIAPTLKTKKEFESKAEAAIEKEFGRYHYCLRFKDRRLWILPHVFIALAGVVLAAVSALSTC
jgi:hypothetical protein